MVSYLLLFILMILGGIAVLAVASTWPRKKGKGVFIAFVVVAFLVQPLIGLMQNLAIEAAVNRNYFGASRRLDTLNLSSQLVSGLSFVSLLLLLVYALIKLQRGSEAVTAPGVDLDLGPRWKTDLNSKDRIGVARRREWAWMIDFSPALLWVFTFRINALPATEIAEYLPTFWLLFGVTVPVFFIYWILKDSIGGVSIGKWITGCRVVSQKTGVPIGPGQSTIRNLLFILPGAALLELVVASARVDKRRLGDLFAATTVVTGPPDWMDGREVARSAPQIEAQGQSIPHPLDD